MVVAVVGVAVVAVFLSFSLCGVIHLCASSLSLF